MTTFETRQFYFAALSDKPGFFGTLTHEAFFGKPTEEEMDGWYKRNEHSTYSEAQSDDPEHQKLPKLTAAQAKDVGDHCFYSGADLTVATLVAATHGMGRMHDYCDTQNVYSMPGAPGMPEEQLKWVGSGLAPVAA